MQITMDMLESTSMKKIFGFELSKVGMQDREDVKHNCIVEILKATKNKTDEIPPNKFPSFCQTVIKRTVVDYYRKTNRKIDQNSTLVNFCDGFDKDSEDSSSADYFSVTVEESCYALVELQADYDLHIGQFTNREREVLDYMLYNPNGLDMTMSEIARELNLNKSSATRAVQKLRLLVS